MDLAKLNQASGIITYRGAATLESKEGIFIDGDIKTFEIPIDGISRVADERVIENLPMIRVVPSGEWTNPELLLPYFGFPEGQFMLPVVPSTIDAGTDIVTAAGHPFITGDRILIGCRAGGTLPQIGGADVNEDTFYYVRKLSSSTMSIHASRAGALADTGGVNFSLAGSGVRLVAQWDLVLNLVDGRQFTFHAVGILKQPNLGLQAEATPFDEIQFQPFVRSRMQPQEANSIFTEADVAFPGWTANSSDIKTQAQMVAWADQLVVEDIHLDDDDLTITDHGLDTGAKVYIGTTGTLPAATPALDPDQAYFVNVSDEDTLSLHTNAVDAAAGTNPVNFSAAGAGVIFLTVDNPPFTLQETEAGVKVSSSLTFAPRKSDRSGMYNQQFDGIRIEVALIPLTVSTSQVLAALKMQGAGAERGASLAARAKPLSVFSNGMFVRINGAALKKAGAEQSTKNTEAREMTFVNTRSVVAGVKVAAGYVGTSIAGSDTTYSETV